MRRPQLLPDRPPPDAPRDVVGRSHLYTYLALALSFSHQLATGASFVTHPSARAWWTVLWLATAGTCLAYRIGLPVPAQRAPPPARGPRSAESPGVVSLVCEGRALDRLAVAGGQFLQWRFLTPGLWWQAHPYSLLGAPVPDPSARHGQGPRGHSAALSRLRPGTRVAIEGPYGAFTRRRAHQRPGRAGRRRRRDHPDPRPARGPSAPRPGRRASCAAPPCRSCRCSTRSVALVERARRPAP